MMHFHRQLYNDIPNRRKLTLIYAKTLFMNNCEIKMRIRFVYTVIVQIIYYVMSMIATFQD